MTLPKFLLCKSDQDEPGTEYVLHTDNPRYLAIVDIKNPLSQINPIQWIDEPNLQDVQSLATLMREMGDWYVREIS